MPAEARGRVGGRLPISKTEHQKAPPRPFLRCLNAALKELLREPNHHQRKSNQKEEGARDFVVVFRSHVAKGQISGSAQRYIRLSAGIRVNAGPSREDFAIVHWRMRVVPLRTVNERLSLAANLRSQLNMRTRRGSNPRPSA
jgi:hypothetical protein